MSNIDITIFEQRSDDKEIGHSVSVPTYLIPNIGEEFYIATEPPVKAFLITGKRIVLLDGDQHHVALKGVRLDIP